MTRSNLVVAEGGDAVEYGVSLNVGDDLLADSVSLIFTVDDWSVVQTVAVSASDDSFAESTENHAITHAIASDDARYNDIFVADVAVLIQDNDVAGAENFGHVCAWLSRAKAVQQLEYGYER